MTQILKSFWRCLPIAGFFAISEEISAIELSDFRVPFMTEIPMDVVAAAQSSNSILLTWNDVVDDAGYIIQRSTDMSSGFVQIGEADMNAISFTSSNLANHSTEYFFRVAAKGTPNSNFSAVVSATTNAPEPPTNLASETVTAISVVLNWDDNTTFETGYRIERSDDMGMSFSFVGEVDADIETFTDIGLTGLTTYQYQVAGKLGTIDLTDYSDFLEVTTIAPVVPNGVPNGLTVTVLSESEIRVNWSDQSTNETGFTIERSDFIDDLYKEVGEVASNVVSFTSSDLQANSSYFFRIIAFNDEGVTSPSTSVSATTDVAAPLAPTSLKSTDVATNSISIAWVDNASFEDGYDVHIAVGATFNSVAKLEADIESYIITDLSEITLYSIKVIAFNSTGETSSNEIKVATTQEPPVAPSDLTFTLNETGDEIALSWIDNSDNEDIFSIERSVGDTENFEELFEVDFDVTSFVDQIEVGVNHFYRVRALNSGGDSDYSNVTGNVLAALNSERIEEHLSLYPNPSTGVVNLSLNGTRSQIERIRVFDYTGRLFDSYELNMHDVTTSIDLSEKADGLYLIEMDIDGSTFSRKILLRK